MLFHKRFAHREGWWATKLNTWWPRGFNVAGTGGEHKGGARNDWWRYRQTYSKEWRENADTRLKEGYAKIHDMCRNIETKGEEGWEDLKAESPEGKRQILQALNVDGQLGGSCDRKWTGWSGRA